MPWARQLVCLSTVPTADEHGWAAPEHGGDDSVEVETHAWIEALLPSENGRGEPSGSSRPDQPPVGRRASRQDRPRRYFADVPPVHGV